MWPGVRSGNRFRFGAAILGIAALPSLLAAAVNTYPSYTAQSIVSTATQTAQALAPNSIATIYGANLSDSTSAASAPPGSTLPITLAGVSVYVNSLFAHLFYVSPTQINFLIPYELIPGTVTIQVARDGLAGPPVEILLNSTAPGLFPWNGNTAIATHLSGALLTSAAPAGPGEIVILYAAGLGRVNPDTTSGRLAISAATILALPQLQILLAGLAVPAQNILYAGLAPGYAGLYQINLRLPDTLTANPEIRILAAGQISPPSILLPANASAPSLSK